MRVKNLGKHISVLLIGLVAVFLSACTQNNDNNKVNMVAPPSSHIAISFDFERQSGNATNQFVIWIEDAGGNLVRTIYVTGFTTRRGHRNRPDAIPLWVSKANASAINWDDVDAISGATPDEGRLEFFWDLKDQDGQVVPNGKYRYFIEGTIRWSNQILFSGEIIIDYDISITEAVVEYTFEANNNRRPALTEFSEETNMISSVLVEYRPE